jgi:hypothetical protein
VRTIHGWSGWARPALIGVLAAVALAVAACASPSRPASTSTPVGAGPQPTLSSKPIAPVISSTYDKVMVIPEENETDSAVIGSSSAPYLTKLAATYGNATNMQAGYPVDCPSLAAYILFTSGNRDGICDDNPPADHPLSGDNIFQQVATAGLQWRQYAESMTSNCQRTDGAAGGYLVRHAPPPYYTSEATRCASWDVPTGTTTSGQLHSDLASGLPAYSIVTPNACDDMHGATTCSTSLVKRGDDWLAKWMPQIIASADFQQARLVVIITWDEGSATSNHIPTLVLSRTTVGLRSATEFTHCSTLRSTEEVLGLPLIGCAATAASLRRAFDF